MADYQLNRTWAQIKAWMDRLWDLDAASGDEINTGTNTTKFVTAKAIEDSDLARMSDLSKVIVGINDQTGTTYTLALTDAGKLVTCENANAITLTVPKNSVVAFPVNTVITIEQKGAGVVTTAPVDGDVTIVKYGGLKTAGQYACAQLLKIATNEWLFIGGVA